MSRQGDAGDGSGTSNNGTNGSGGAPSSHSDSGGSYSGMGSLSFGNDAPAGSTYDAATGGWSSAGLSASDQKAMDRMTSRVPDGKVDRVDALGNGLASSQMTGFERFQKGAYDFGIRAPGTTLDDLQAEESSPQGITDKLQATRMGNVGGVLDGMGRTAMASVPGGGLIMSAANTANNISRGQPVAEAVGNFAKDQFRGFATGKLNGLIGSALGKDAMRAVGDYNTVASLGNAVGATSLPGINPGRMVADAVVGKSTTPQARQTSTDAGLTTPDGGPVDGFGGWSSGGGGSSRAEEVKPEAAADEPATPVAAATSAKPKRFKNTSYADWQTNKGG
jgi:hypothetical protein